MKAPVIFRLVLFCLFFGMTASVVQAQWFGKKDNADELYERAVKETEKKNYTQAIALSQEALKQRPDFLDMELLLGRLYTLTSQWNKARQHVGNVLKKDPKYLDAHYYKINIEVSTRQYNAALVAVDAALKEFPDRKDLMIRKLGVLDAAGFMLEGNLFAESLIRRFPRDTEVKKAYTGHYIERARRYRSQDLPGSAVASLNKALEADPGNAEAREMLNAADLNTQTRAAAVEKVIAELETNPTSFDLLMKKLNILREDLRYAEALTVLQTIYRHHPSNAEARSLETELRKEAAAFYSQTDPYLLYQSILERNPGDRESLRKVIGLATSRGAYREAMTWINAGLRREPQASDLLLLKLDLLEYERQYTEAARIAGDMLKRGARNNDLQKRFIELKVASARYYSSQQQYTESLSELHDAKRVSPKDTSVLDVLVNIYSAQRQFDQALSVLNELQEITPQDDYTLKQASLLADAGRYDESADILQDLIRKNPGDQRYLTSYVENRLLAGNRLLQQDEFGLATQQLHAVLQHDPNNRDALNYLINLYSATNNLDSALVITDRALASYPADREFLLKKSSVLNSDRQYSEANILVKELMTRYPYTLQYRNAYKENLLSAANQLKREQQLDQALANYRQVLELDAKDSTSYQNLVNAYLEKKDYDTVHIYINKALHWYPDWSDLYLKRAETFEEQKNFAAAAAAADTLLRMNPSPVYRDYADYLTSKTMRNQFGMHFLRTRYDYSDDRYDIATVEYTRLFKKGSIGGRINYAGRQLGTGVQGEVEMYYTHQPKWYSHGHVAFANKVVFPQWRLGYTLYRTFQHDGEVGLGIRYMQRDTLQNMSGLLALSRGFGDFWFNARAYAIWEESDINTSFSLVGRYYMNKRQDYLSMTVGLGTSPDDRSRLIQFSELSGLLTRSVGAGYQRTFHHRTSLGLNGTWITQKIGDQQFQNQYDLYISVIRKF